MSVYLEFFQIFFCCSFYNSDNNTKKRERGKKKGRMDKEGREGEREGGGQACCNSAIVDLSGFFFCLSCPENLCLDCASS